MKKLTLSLFFFFFLKAAISQCPVIDNTWTKLSSLVQSPGSDVMIQSNQKIFIDASQSGLKIGMLHIMSGGIVAFKNESITLTVNQIHVEGTLQIGCSAAPISRANQITLIFDNGKKNVFDQDLELMVHPGGSLIMFGEKGAVTGAPNSGISWTYLQQPAGPSDIYGPGKGVEVPVPPGGEKKLTLAADVSKDWQPNDWILVATTDFVPDNSEFVQIQSILRSAVDGTSLVTLNPATSLKEYHFGSLPPSTDLNKSFWDGKDRNYGVDERAEVALISRSIKLTAAANGNRGGDIHIMQGFREVRLQGVEIEKFGKDTLSNYPLHFHMCGNVDNSLVTINSNSIHHSFNKGITVHSTSNLNITNNVVARVIGHGYFLEDGDEQNNTFTGNLVAGTMLAGFDNKSSTVMWKGDFLAPQIKYVGNNVNAVTTADGLAPTGFWITHPNNTFAFNNVAGCMGQGRGFWVLPQKSDATTIAPNINNCRVHGAYNGLDLAADGGVGANVNSNLLPLRRDIVHNTSVDSVIKFTNITATRNRLIGIWLRPGFNHVDHARLATNRQSASLVSSGGAEGSRPGIWALMSNSVFVGISQNNVNRFPCNGRDDCLGLNGNQKGKGYVDITWNLFGYMFYDGPARLEKNRMVRFYRNLDSLKSHLTSADVAILPNTYEGDAALGWFQSNENAYPPTQYVKQMIWESTDFRHQVYTELTNKAEFKDGDKNTVILDLDGTLTGFMVTDSRGQRIKDRYPVSLNNLPFLSSPLTVDECLSMGNQNQINENRESSLISPHDYATLETIIFYSSNMADNNNVVTFLKDQKDFNEHQSMVMVGRNKTGVYEPKVMDKLGYTIHGTKGMPPFVAFNLADVSKPDITKSPFRVRVGICYNSTGSISLTGKDFLVQKGRSSIGDPGLILDALKLSKVYRFNRDSCWNFPFTFDKYTQNCPLDAQVLRQTSSWDSLVMDTTGSVYYFDAKMGMLFLNIIQNEKNTDGPSPVFVGKEYAEGLPFSFYSFPPKGAVAYTVRVMNKAYQPGGSTKCDCYLSKTGIPGERDYTALYPRFNYSLAKVPEANIQDPLQQNILNLPGIKGSPILQSNIVEVPNPLNGQLFPFKIISTPSLQPLCPITTNVPAGSKN